MKLATIINVLMLLWPISSLAQQAWIPTLVRYHLNIDFYDIKIHQGIVYALGDDPDPRSFATSILVSSNDWSKVISFRLSPIKNEDIIQILQVTNEGRVLGRGVTTMIEFNLEGEYQKTYQIPRSELWYPFVPWAPDQILMIVGGEQDSTWLELRAFEDGTLKRVELPFDRNILGRYVSNVVMREKVLVLGSGNDRQGPHHIDVFADNQHVGHFEYEMPGYGFRLNSLNSLIIYGGTVWCAGENFNLCRVKSGVIQSVLPVDPTNTLWINQIAALRDSLILLATNTDAFTEWRLYDIAADSVTFIGLGNTAKSFTFDGDTTVWVASKRGIYAFSLADYLAPLPVAPAQPQGFAVVDTGAVSARVEWPAYAPGVPLDHLALIANSDTVATFADTTAGSYTLWNLAPDSDVALELVALAQNGLTSQPAEASLRTLRLASGQQLAGGGWLVTLGDSLVFWPQTLVFRLPQAAPPGVDFQISFRLEADEMPLTLAANTADLEDQGLVSPDRVVELLLPEVLRVQEVHVQASAAVADLGLGYARSAAYSPPPTDFALHQNYPNPFRDQTTIVLDLPRAEGDSPFDETSMLRQVEVVIYNLLGREVRRFGAALVPGSRVAITWDGRDFVGRPLPSGIYFYRIYAPEWRSPFQRTLLLR